ncbi:MAG: sigma-70 family RNA polymerase sigma factor [Planctomycetales bacterium]|nr:sigma-70 family RNA polymerase sigma factor [Planctomycetales bacterium]
MILRLPNAADAAAWEEFAEIYGPIVYRMGLGHGMQPADAEDVVQEVLCSVAKSVPQWLERADRGKFRAWLLRISRNTAINFLTRRATRPLGAGGEDAARELAELAAADDLSRQFDLEYRREVFTRAAEQVRNLVNEPTWQAFWMTHVEGVSIADAATRIGVSVGSIYVSRSRVMARMQEFVQKAMDDP